MDEEYFKERFNHNIDRLLFFHKINQLPKKSDQLFTNTNFFKVLSHIEELCLYCSGENREELWETVCSIVEDFYSCRCHNEEYRKRLKSLKFNLSN